MTNLSADADDITVFPTVAGTYNYQYVVIDNFGCQYDTSVNVTINPNPIVFAGNDTTLCGGNVLQLLGEISGPGASSDCEYTLLLDDTFGDGWNGNTVTVTTVNGCEYTQVYRNLIVAHDAPNANFFVNPDYVSMLEPVVNLYDISSSDVISWSWTIPDAISPLSATTEDVLNVIFPIDAPGVYPVTLVTVNGFGCIDSVTRFVTIINEVLLFAPNTFTPDDDEFNQVWTFYISGIDVYDFSLRLFNRWGEVIWESHDPSVSWDGTYHGEIVPDGTYTWFMECADSYNDKRYTFQGHVNIIR
jgi:gliding motility-associated-like protein